MLQTVAPQHGAWIFENIPSFAVCIVILVLLGIIHQSVYVGASAWEWIVSCVRLQGSHGSQSADILIRMAECPI